MTLTAVTAAQSLGHEYSNIVLNSFGMWGEGGGETKINTFLFLRQNVFQKFVGPSFVKSVKVVYVEVIEKPHNFHELRIKPQTNVSIQQYLVFNLQKSYKLLFSCN